MKRFKIFSLVAVVMVATILKTSNGMTMDQIKQAAKMMRSMCLPKTGVSLDALAAAEAGQFAADDRNLKCYMKCIMGMMQSVKKDKYYPDAAIAMAKKMLPEDIRDRSIAVMEKCKTAWNGHEDACESAYAVTVCMYETDPEMFFFP